MSVENFTKITDETDVKAWIKTEVIRDSFDHNGFRVTWVDWNSDFRNSDLQIEDIIVGYDDVSFESFLEPGKHGSAIGQYGEIGYWQKLDAKHEQIITLEVFRQGIEAPLKIKGRLLAQRFYSNEKGDRSLAPRGPPIMSRDEFFSTWSTWYEKLVWKMSYILDGGWDFRTINNKKELEEHDDHKKRIDYLIEKYPGLFADTVLYDWEKVRKNLLGKKLDEVDLEYRELGAKRADVVKQEAQEAWELFFQKIKNDRIPAFPASDVDERESVTDKIIELPWITPRGNIINDLGQTYAVIGDRTQGFYFAQLSNLLSVRKFYDAMYRYHSQINPKLRERYQYIARITGEPGLITFNGRAVTGLMTKIIAVRAGDGEFFVDLQDVEDAEKTWFAGEEETSQFAPIDLPENASPRDIMESMIETVKLGHEESWKKHFATWRAYKYWENHIAFDPSYNPHSLFSSAWEQSRKLIMGRVYDVKVDRIGKIHRIIKKDPSIGVPNIDEVKVFLDHYESMDDHYQSFVDRNVRRRWTLQRLDEGAWKIANVQVI